MTKHLIIGLGEVGTALREIFDCDGLDIEGGAEFKGYDFIHICFPWSKSFIEEVKRYQKEYLRAKGITVIHSTVPIGTSSKLKAVHSPIRGIHPILKESIETFVKFFGGSDTKKAAKEFEERGIVTYSSKNSRNTEALKLWDTTIYGDNIILEKEIHDFCKKNKLDFGLVYGYANATYNVGYEALGYPEYKRYILSHVRGKIGGHCIIQNCDLLNTPTAKRIKKFNKTINVYKD